MDDFPKTLVSIDHGLKYRGKIYDNHEVRIKELEGVSKKLSSPNSHFPFPLPKHSSNFGSLSGFSHKTKIDVPRFDREDGKDTTREIIMRFCFVAELKSQSIN
jgi:hypothetical protein